MQKLAGGLLFLFAAHSSSLAGTPPEARGPDVDLLAACSGGSVVVCSAPTRGECQQIITHVQLNGGPADEVWTLREPGCEKWGDGTWQVVFDTDRGTNTGGGDIG